MIPRLGGVPDPAPLYIAFMAQLRAAGFAGDLSVSDADRTVLATDNSIYQVLPQALACPRDQDDVVRLARLAASPEFRTLKFTPRGGGTGTNGQSLTDGLVVDLSRHMNRILEINVEERWARVEAGVVKDQLDHALRAHGLFFAPELSTSNRATLGGMINTDASGQGSCLYGKTRDHVLELVTVLLDGTAWRSRPLDRAALDAIKSRQDRVGAVHRLLDDIREKQADLIERHFPKLNRCLTGYDLAHLNDAQGRFDLNAILCGSEGTLGIVTEAVLNLMPVPGYSALVNLRYASFDAALRDAQTLMALGAASIETLDSTVLELAQHDMGWDNIREFFPRADGALIQGVNLIEFIGDSEAEVRARIEVATASLSSEAGSKTGSEAGRGREGFTLAWGAEAVERIWTLRKRAVGLLGNMQGDQRPIPFVEDTAVPPHNLADYIAEFRAALDRRGLRYGMFGHVDAGVLHVRPALDMKDPAQVALIREISEEVVALTSKYGGLLWGEHGKGVRSEFSPRVFGPLYPSLQAIKAAFDPANQLNPGKIAPPEGSAIFTVDGTPMRGQFDRTIPPIVRAGYEKAMHCNGNGACYNFDLDDAMCPSWKGTRERRHSPKGRASLLREWLRQLARAGCDPLAESVRLRRSAGWTSWPARMANTLAKRRGKSDFSHEVKEALDGCLACKSCTGQCPVKVDVPKLRSQFLELYHGRYLRPLRDYIVGSVEHTAPWLARMPRLSNALMNSGPGRALMAAAGLVATPSLSPVSVAHEIRRRGIRLATPAALASLGEDERKHSVIVVQDAFTSLYETPLLLDLLDLIAGLGFRAWLAPYRPNGKALHVQGFLGAFERIATVNAAMLQALARTGIELIGVDPAMTLAYRMEYADALGGRDQVPPVLLIQEWLAGHADVLPDLGRGDAADSPAYLLPHCTERTNASPAVRAWEQTFMQCGLTLEVLPSGCCGMAGTWGHETQHRKLSEHIYSLSWAKHVATDGRRGALLADGYSCRSQAMLVDGVRLMHPVQLLLQRLRALPASHESRMQAVS